MYCRPHSTPEMNESVKAWRNFTFQTTIPHLVGAEVQAVVVQLCALALAIRSHQGNKHVVVCSRQTHVPRGHVHCIHSHDGNLEQSTNVTNRSIEGHSLNFLDTDLLLPTLRCKDLQVNSVLVVFVSKSFHCFCKGRPYDRALLRSKTESLEMGFWN